MAGAVNTKELAAYFGVSEQDIKTYIQEFHAIDANKDGKITAEELRAGLGLFGCPLTLEDAKKMVKSADTNNDNTIDLMEFLTMVTRAIKSSNLEKEGMQAFQVFDVNHDGFISMNELRATMAKLGQQLSDADAQEMMNQYDTNKDGLIDYTEFLAAWKQVMNNKGQTK